MTQEAADRSIIIIGAGIIGLACAHYLSAEGHKVTVLDSGKIAEGCSQSNCGHIIPSHILPLQSPEALKVGLRSLFDRTSAFRIRPQLKLSFLNWMIQFARQCSDRNMLLAAAHLKPILDSAFAEYERLVAAHVFEADWQKSGLIYAFKTQKALEGFKRSDDLLQEYFGVAAAFLDRQALQDQDPAFKKDLAGGFLYRDDALLQPEKLTLSWAEHLKKRGVTFVENCHVTGIHKKAGTIRHLETSSGLLEVEQLVIAAGAFSATFARELGCSIPVIPGKGYSLTFEKPDICPKTSVILPEKNVAITPFANSLRIGSMMEFTGFDSSIPQRRIKQLRTSADEYLLSDYSGLKERSWFGWRPMTWDSLPIIGRLPKLSNALIATGHGMMGVMLAPATGRLIADIINENECHIAEAPYSPARF